jgi:hypothetical protein
MAKKKDIFDDFLDKNFGQSALHIETPIGGERSSSAEERAAIANGGSLAEVPRPDSRVPDIVDESAAVKRGPGRPKGSGRGDTVFVNFNIDRKMKHDLDILKVSQYRVSLTELFSEAIFDLLKKYHVEGY